MTIFGIRCSSSWPPRSYFLPKLNGQLSEDHTVIPNDLWGAVLFPWVVEPELGGAYGSTSCWICFFYNIYIYIYIMHHTLYPIRFDHGWFYPWWLSLVVKPPSMPRDQLFVVNSDLANFRLHAHCAAGTWNHKHLPVPTQSINLFIW